MNRVNLYLFVCGSFHADLNERKILFTIFHNLDTMAEFESYCKNGNKKTGVF